MLSDGEPTGYAYPDGTMMRVGDVVEFEEDGGGRFGIVGGGNAHPLISVKTSRGSGCFILHSALRLVRAFPFRRERLDLPAGHPYAVPDEVYQVALARLKPMGERVRHARLVVFEGTPERVAKQIALSTDVPFRIVSRNLLVTVEQTTESPCPS